MPRNRILAGWKDDRTFHYAGRGLARRGVLRSAANPSLMASLVFRIAAGGPGVVRALARYAGILLFSSDVAYGVQFRGPFEVPHPVGIVLGRGSIIGSRVRLYQGVTLGTEPKGGYPVLGDDCVVYAGAVISGAVVVGDGCKVGANTLLRHSLTPGQTFRAQKSER